MTTIDTTSRHDEGELTPVGGQYKDRLLRRGRNPASVYNFERAWRSLQTFCQERGIDTKSISSEQMEEYVSSLAYAPTTKRMYLAQIRAAYRYAIARGITTYDPTIDIELPKEPDKLVRTISPRRLREIKGECHNARQWMMFHLFAYTGCRKNEIRELSWDAVSLEDETIFVVGKGGKGRLVPIHPALGEVLASTKHREGTAVIANPYGCPFHYNYFDYLLKSFAPDVTFHDFRRTVASSLDANGVEEGLIMRIMGWAPKTVFDKHYRSIAPERLSAAILRLYADDPV